MMLFLENDLPVYASETDELSPYKERLEELNEKLGTDYIIDGNDKTVVDYFKNMSIDEFEQFICDAYKNDTNYGENYLPKTMNDIVNNGISRSRNTLKRVEQKSYYDNCSKYVAANVTDATVRKLTINYTAI